MALTGKRPSVTVIGAILAVSILVTAATVVGLQRWPADDGTATAADLTGGAIEPEGVVVEVNRDDAAGALIGSQPADGATDVDPQAGFRLQFDRSLADAPAMRAEVRTLDGGAAFQAPARSMSIDLTRQNLSFAFDRPLAPSTDHRLTVSGLQWEDGRSVEPLEIGFRTGVLLGGSDRFEVVELRAVTGPTGVTFGPDGHGYATTVDGEIIRFGLDADGLPTGEQEVVLHNPDFQFIAMDFEPGTDSLVWVSQWRKQPDDEFSSEIARYDLTVGLGSEAKKVVGLPRHPNGNHSVQGLDFHAGRLYAAVGSVTAGGARSDTYFGDPVLMENPISAAIIEIDHSEIDGPFDTSTAVINQRSSPVRLFATGTRNPYDLLWHSNGSLYANVNQNGGSSDENSAPPTDGPCRGLPEVLASNQIPDTLNLIERGRYYGHPNPSRGECVVMGGGQGPFAVGGYGPDQEPEPNFDADLITYYAGDRDGSFGISVNGMDEYRGSGPLNGAIISADFAGSRSILVARPASPLSRMNLDGPIERVAAAGGEAATFVHPVDVASSRSGHLLVADFGEWLGGRFGDGGAVYFLRAIDR